MRTIIAGGRSYWLTPEDIAFLDGIRDSITEVVSGCASGADSHGEWWAQQRGIPVKRFPADWGAGRGSGFVRNVQMAKYAQAVVLFPGGAGTNHMAKTARRYGLRIHDQRT